MAVSPRLHRVLATEVSNSNLMDETKTQPAAPLASRPPVAGAAPASTRPPRRMGGGGGGRRPPRRGGGEREKRELDQKTLALDRVTRVTAGGKRMSFRAALIVGDRKGRVGLGIAKGADVQIAMDKAYRQAKKKLLRVPLVEDSIPHAVWIKFGSARVMIKPAPRGTGLKCGGAVRVVFELAGVPNAVSKVVNSTNKINIAKATLNAIQQLRIPKGEASKAESKDVKAVS